MNPSILVVDDDPVVRELLRNYLGPRGYSVSLLEDGIALERTLEAERPALVVLDIMMPALDGVSALRALRVAGNDVPVILLTARDDVIDRVNDLELGARALTPWLARAPQISLFQSRYEPEADVGMAAPRPRKVDINSRELLSIADVIDSLWCSR